MVRKSNKKEKPGFDRDIMVSKGFVEMLSVGAGMVILNFAGVRIEIALPLLLGAFRALRNWWKHRNL